MKQNPKTKIKVSDTTPVMRCRTIRRRKMNGSTDTNAWGVGATLVPQEKIDIEEMGAISQQRCTVTQTDVRAAWNMLEVIIADALANGRRVELGNLGILSLDVRVKGLKEPGQRLRPTDLEVGSISLKPGALLQKQLQRVSFKIDHHCPEPLSSDLLDEALCNYFDNHAHEGINVREFTHLCGYRETSARALLKEYVAAGVMERVPMSRGYYRPTEGNFGW